MSRIARGVLLLAGAFAAGQAQACSCVRSSLEQRIERAPVVAVVRIESLRRNPAWPGNADAGYERVQPIVVGFELIEAYRGADLLPETLVTGFGGGDCGLPLQPAEDVLVIGEPETGGPHADSLRLSICSGSRVLGIHSLLGERDSDDPRRLRWDAVLDGIRQHVESGAPIHTCVAQILQLVPPPPGPDDDTADCADYLDGYGQPGSPPELPRGR